MPGRTSTKVLVNRFGFSTDAIQTMRNVMPTLPLDRVVEAWARYILAAESREERNWHISGEDKPLLEGLIGQEIKLCKPKAQSYLLPGGRYTPDFLYIFQDGTRVVVEVKGSKHQKGYKDAIAKMRAAATLHWYDRFVLATRQKGGWELEEIKPDTDFTTELQALAEEIVSTETILEATND